MSRDRVAYNLESACRVAGRFIEADTMTDTEAKQILGFPASARPTPEEVEQAYKPLAIKFHPDRPTGDLDKMKQLNRARDVLKRSPQPRLERGAPPGGWSPQDEVRKKEPPKVVDTIKGTPFAQAVAKAPKGVEWKFISTLAYMSGSPATGHTSSECWVAVGKTATQWVALGIQRRLPNRHMDIHKGGWVEVEESWEFQAKETPAKGDAIKQVALIMKGAFGMFADGTIPDAPKKFVAFSDLSQATVRAVKHSGGVAFKDIMVSTGFVAEGSKGVAGRKSIVEMWTKYSTERSKRMKELKGAKLTSPDVYDFFVRVNGHEYKLEDDTIESLDKSGFFFAVFKYKFGEGAPKQLNKVRGTGVFGAGPDVVITMLADNLTGEPSTLQIALQKAAEEWAPEPKTAALIVERFLSE